MARDHLETIMPGGDAAPRQRAVSAAPTFGFAPISFAARARGSTDGFCWRKPAARDNYAAPARRHVRAIFGAFLPTCVGLAAPGARVFGQLIRMVAPSLDPGGPVARFLRGSYVFVLRCESLPLPLFSLRAVARRQMDAQHREKRRWISRAEKIRKCCKLLLEWTPLVLNLNRKSCAEEI